MDVMIFVVALLFVLVVNVIMSFSTDTKIEGSILKQGWLLKQS